jgi:hypothetical protein
MATAQQSSRTTRQARPRRRSSPTSRPARCRAKFLRYFPGGYHDETYVDWERSYKWQAHLQWQAQLGPEIFATLIKSRQYEEIAARAVRIESRTNLLFSFEKMALRDAVRNPAGAQAFAHGLDEWLHSDADAAEAFEKWISVVATLPRRQTRVLTWPVVTVFGFIAQPDRHIFLKPNVTRTAANAYGFPFVYKSRPSWDTYASVLDFADAVRRDTRDLRPRDMIDLQSFIWVQGSDEY